MKYQDIPDALLVHNYIQGDERALEVLIKRHQTKIYGFILSKLSDGDLADDIFQETFIKVINTLSSGKYNEEGKFLPWVIRIAHNLIMDNYRKEKRSIVQVPNFEDSVLTFFVDEGESMHEYMEKEYLEQEVRMLIDGLPEDQKYVLTMRIDQDLTFKEIAEKTDVSINTALGRMRYALLNMKKMMDQRIS
ncbi:MAG: sigma-70 family RNA polymerase sigma factor [Flavobacteriaceae bacterium]|jgi:RNA polymerase sigma-70 factor (ECF subfamily)|nr:sigma-70 family RNA polymerase sigma factor [Flavobacteriaceae bacterium]